MNRRQLLKILVGVLGGVLVGGVSGTPARATTFGVARITEIRLGLTREPTQVHFQLSQSAKHTLFHLKNPERLVLDIEGAELGAGLVLPTVRGEVIQAVRTGIPRPGVIRVVFDLGSEVRAKTTLHPDPATGGGFQLLLELLTKEPAGSEGTPAARDSGREKGAHQGSPSERRGRPSEQKPVVIVLDPGHGGNDPGAIGVQGTREKDIVLSVALKLAARINKMPGFRAYLTREEDHYVPLVERVTQARRHQPDLFISIHADAYRVQSARGASVYCLSERGKLPMDVAVRELVERENNTDLIGGVDLGQVPDREVAGILFDLTQRETINRSLAFGGELLAALKSVTNVKYDHVVQAGFVVLKAPDIPSVLVELAFLTNPEEEAKLRQESYQNLLVQALATGAANFANAAANRVTRPNGVRVVAGNDRRKREWRSARRW